MLPSHGLRHTRRTSLHGRSSTWEGPRGEATPSAGRRRGAARTTRVFMEDETGLGPPRRGETPFVLEQSPWAALLAPARSVNLRFLVFRERGLPMRLCL